MDTILFHKDVLGHGRIPFSSQVISFDDILTTMVKTGRDLQGGYRETGEKGLAELIK